ncbi:MAG: hypothetical protein SNG59_05035, partial [Rikenellaceae bacterium]
GCKYMPFIRDYQTFLSLFLKLFNNTYTTSLDTKHLTLEKITPLTVSKKTNPTNKAIFGLYII